MQSKPLHLKGLNGLRAIAAMAVVISHITLALESFNLYPYIFGQNADGSPKGLDMAGFGVSIFFSLSGFLITYLLLLEKEKDQIDIKKFYIRRVLRIWPLYYLYLAICVIVILSIGASLKGNSLLFYLFYAANVPFIINNSLRFLAHYWSLGVEEQFYLFWPWVVKQTQKRLLYIVGGTILVLIGLKLICRFFVPGGDQSILYRIIHVTRFHCMLIGAIGAILYYQRNEWFITLFTSKITQLFAWFIMLLIALNSFHIASVLDNEIVSVVALILILGQITVKNRLINLEGRGFDFFGKISYGVYVIHPILIFALAKIIADLEMNAILKYALVYSSVIGATILLSYLSYEYFEKRFLKIKHKYAVIKTSATKNYTDCNEKEPVEEFMKEQGKSEYVHSTS
jgi:peptidoglycan/LPS O-acetylase OafA/YrhL